MVFCFVQNFSFGQHKSYNIYISLSRKAQFFFPEFNIRLYDRNSEPDYFFFPPPKSEYFFRKKTITPPSFKLNGRFLNCFIFSDYESLRDVRKKTTEQLILIKEKYEINRLHVYSCYDFIGKEIFVVRLSKNQYKSTVCTHNSYNM